MSSLFDDLLDWALGLVVGLLEMLPESPIQSWEPEGMQQFQTIMGWINYFVPLGAIAAIMATYLAAVLVWYGIRWFLRIVKYID